MYPTCSQQYQAQSQLTPYAREVLEGFYELVREAGTFVTFAGSAKTYGCLLVFPTASDTTQNAGNQAEATVNVEIARTDFAAAGVTEFSQLTVGTQAQLLHVIAIEDDPGQPIIYFSAKEVE